MDEEVRALDAIRTGFINAGLKDVVWPDSRAALDAEWQRAASTVGAPPDPRHFAFEKLLAGVPSFPRVWWHDDPRAGIDDLAEFLVENGVESRLEDLADVAALEQRANEILDSEDPTSDGEAIAYRRFSAELATVGNGILAKQGTRQRLHGFASLGSDDVDPVYLLITDEQAEALAREGWERG
jgi:hypothetical protein